MNLRSLSPFLGSFLATALVLPFLPQDRKSALPNNARAILEMLDVGTMPDGSPVLVCKTNLHLDPGSTGIWGTGNAANLIVGQMPFSLTDSWGNILVDQTSLSAHGLSNSILAGSGGSMNLQWADGLSFLGHWTWPPGFIPANQGVYIGDLSSEVWIKGIPQ